MGQLESITVEHVGHNTIGGTYNPLFTRKYDPFAASVLSLVHFEDGNNVTTPTDQVSGAVWVNDGASYTKESTLRSKFGSGCLRRLGSTVQSGGAIVTFPGLTTQPYTAEGFIFFEQYYPSSSSYFHNRFYEFGNQSSGLTLKTLSVDPSTNRLVYEYGLSFIAFCGTINTGAWNKIAIVFDGSNTMIFLNGVLGYTHTGNGALSGAIGHWLGKSGGNGAYADTDHDEWRLTWGVARYNASGYVVPTEQFSYP